MTEVMDYEKHWDQSAVTYAYQPTVRHRLRFILNTFARCNPGPETTVFDYGCGMGECLRALQSRFNLRPDQLGGSELTSAGVEATRAKTGSPNIIEGLYPELPRKYDVMVCSEVIEHTDEYGKILEWLYDNLKPGGYLILTTPGGTMDPPDEFYGHIQHFVIEELAGLTKVIGFEIVRQRLWGFPGFTLQKHLTKRYFDHVRDAYMESGLTPKKKILYNLAYACYFVHDVINAGPQIFIHARRPSTSAESRSRA